MFVVMILNSIFSPLQQHLQPGATASAAWCRFQQYPSHDSRVKLNDDEVLSGLPNDEFVLKPFDESESAEGWPVPNLHLLLQKHFFSGIPNVCDVCRARALTLLQMAESDNFTLAKSSKRL
jgi:hypothetical protein